MPEYTSIIHGKNGLTIHQDWDEPDNFKQYVENSGGSISWAKLFETLTGVEVTAFESEVAGG